ncbi:N-acetylmuramoyl-L-alanine amidase [Bradyrhizobium jicamae]|uniref:N-acetylmuramoyl-L-alanine amidase n=1 Tax=Bradyrhizobium jicamae TaxID=280332 RepID=A0ABS5FI97_9BRAD|nr:peptidoglycan recognition family protein [Bradyrhizobium jicamae]MBR0796111.1 N-acetylmuramoyl-L-alanine amidase [Bradyrhizobium jicamae]
MAHFFLPESDNKFNPKAAMDSPISELFIRAGTPARFGIWGGGWSGERLVVKVYRGASVINDDPGPVSSDVGNNIYVYVVSGLQDGDLIYGMLPGGEVRFTSELRVRTASNRASDVMGEEAQHFKSKEPFSRDTICPLAVPYLALPLPDDKFPQAMIRLEEKCVGGSLNAVHGLSVHATGGNDVRTSSQMARWGCIETWNGNGASAHFGISGSGTIIQFIPTDRIANAQSDGNTHWISVEIDNNGNLPMNLRQLESAKSLLGWVCARYAVPRTVATGCVFGRTNPAFDGVTTLVCEAVGGFVTESVNWAVLSRGLSCHWWLDSHKTGPHVHACPGSGIMRQLPSIAKPGLVC